MSKGVLVDVTRCIGCKACQTACKQWNDMPSNRPEFDNNLGSPAKTNGYTWTTVYHRVVEKDNQDIMRMTKFQCMHCLDPACVSACFSKAFQRDPETGAAVYRSHLCVGCRLCMLACPFDVPKFQWDKVFPLVSKCQFCFDPKGHYDRIGHGEGPACVSTCPTQALMFGERDEMLQEAWNRINSMPHYIKHVYGEKEAGGTAWMYISDVPFEDLGLRGDVGERAIPEYSHEFLKYTPPVIVAWGGLLTAMYLYTKRRKDIAAEKDKGFKA